MNNNKCKHWRKRTEKGKTYFWCIKYDKEATRFCKCNDIDYREYKKLEAKTPMKNKTYKQAKLERDRFSAFTTDLNKCFLCHSNYNISKHEIFRGRNRANSMRFGLVLPLCEACHSKYQEDKLFNEIWHKKGQKQFETKHTRDEFIKIFRINYLD